jgi:hypothetical protein
MNTLDGDLSSARQIKCTGGFELPCSAKKAFPFFSPEGERNWAPGWDPRPLFPDQILFRKDTVFLLGAGTDESIWTIVDVDWERYRAEYVRVAPASHMAHIFVNVAPQGDDRSQVSVSYVVTAFGENAAVQLEPFSERAYEVRMEDWRRQISASLATKTDDV